MLCEYCLKIRPPHISYNKKDKKQHQCIVRHHPDFNSLLASAHAGCELCTLFRPFVEHAISRLRGEVHVAESDCSDSDGSGFTYEDPFLSESESSPESDYESGSGYNTDDNDDNDDNDEDHANEAEDGGGGDNEDDQGDATSWDDKVSASHSSGAGSDIRQHNRHRAPLSSDGEGESVDETDLRKRGEVLRWLLTKKESATGPAQLWIRGTAKVSKEDEKVNNQTKSHESMSLISLSAGSIDGTQISYNDSSYCLDGVQYDSRQSLATAAPGLWNHRYNPLKIRVGRKPPARALRPNFEFFQRRGTSPWNLDAIMSGRWIEGPEDFDPPVKGLDIVEDPGSSDAFSIVGDWLYECDSKHPNCQSKASKWMELPTRVVEVGGANLLPRLISPHSKGIKQGKYATLSHCWGKDAASITKLTKANLDQFQEAIPLDSLPRNFRDAIMITRGLYLNYIWIDALCVQQDSAEDWAVESSKMSQYYGNSTITLSGLASPAADRGLLWQRQSDRKAVEIATETGQVFLRPILDDAVSLVSHAGQSSSSNDRPQITYMPLFDRGWCLQERILSHRVLHYCEQQMVWQCKTCMLSEDGQYNLDPTTERTTKLVDVVDLLPSKLIPESPRSLTPLRLKWHYLVSEYSRLSLTFASDKLPGLSGMASEVARLTGDKYAAGLWLKQLGRELLWERMGGDDDEDDDGKVEIYERLNNGSPSWSWSSLKGSVTNNIEYSGIVRRLPREYDPFYLKATTKLATSDPFGRVLSGKIVLSVMCHPYQGLKTFVKKTKRATTIADEANDEEASSATKSEGSVANSDDDYEFNDFHKLDIPHLGYDWLSVPHIIVCMGEYIADWSRTGPDIAPDPTNKYGYQEFLLLRFVDRARDVAASKELKEGEGEAALRDRYVRVGKASTECGMKRLAITEAKGWTRRTIEMI